MSRLRVTYRRGLDLSACAAGLRDLFAGRDTDEGEAAGMVVAEALAVYLRDHTKE